MNKKIILLGTSTLVLAAVPVISVVSCSGGGTQPSTTNKQIVAKNNLTANNFFDLSQGYTIEQAKKEINNEFILQNKTKLLDGDISLITQKTDIENLVVEGENNSIILKFRIIAEKSYDQDGQINKEPIDIQIVITGFSETSKLEFVEKIESSNLINPQKFTNTSSKYINLANSAISEEGQKDAILSYLKSKTSSNNINLAGNNIYTISMSSGTNTIFNKIFGNNWTDIFTNNDNKDLKNVKQLIFGFKILVKTSNLEKDGVAVYTIEPSYLQFSFESKPQWLDGNSYRYSLSSRSYLLKYDLNVKNSENGTSGEEIN